MKTPLSKERRWSLPDADKLKCEVVDDEGRPLRLKIRNATLILKPKRRKHEP